MPARPVILVLPLHLYRAAHRLVFVSLVVSDGTLFDQAGVVALNGTFHNGGKGAGLIAAFAVLLNGGHQFHCFFTEANTELLGCVGVVVCHW